MNDGAQQNTQTLSQPGGRPAPTEEQRKNAMRYARIFLLLALATMFGSGLVLPWKLLPLALGLAALVVGVIALVKLVRRRMGVVWPVLVSLALLMTGLTTVGLAGMVALWNDTAEYESCMRSALTLDAVETCQDGYLPFQQLR